MMISEQNLNLFQYVFFLGFEMMVEASPLSVFESTIRVYELLGAEVFLYFDLDEFAMTARVDPRTTARPGDVVKFAFDTEKIHVFDKDTEKVITN